MDKQRKQLFLMEILDVGDKFTYLLNSLINIVGKVKYPTQLLYEFSNWWGWFCFEQTNLSRISLWLAEVLVSLLFWKGSTTMTQFLTRIRRKAKEIVFVKRTNFVPLPKHSYKLWKIWMVPKILVIFLMFWHRSLPYYYYQRE